MPNVFKCIESPLPRAENAYFKYIKSNGRITFDEFGLDPIRNPQVIETGHKSVGTGDSGSPFWYTWKQNGYFIEIAVAVNKGIHVYDQYPGAVLEGEENRCRCIATKITREIVEWIHSQM